MQAHTPLAYRLLGSRLVGALSFPHDVDRFLEVVNPRWSVREARATITAVRHQTADTVTLSLRPNAHWQGFVPGQFVALTVEVDGVRRTRCFSPANAADQRHIELTIKAQADGLVTRYLCEHARAGTVVGLGSAQGEFRLSGSPAAHTLLISGGSGITPVMAMLRTLIARGHDGRIDFLHYARRADELLYAEELARIERRHGNVRVLRVYTGSDQSGAASGRFTESQLASLVPDFAGADSYLCGPPGLMASVEAVWRAHGAVSRLSSERFVPATTSTADERAGGELRFARSERLADNDGRSILEQAEAAGLNPAHGCRMGICSTCVCRKTAGTVRNTLTGALSGEADEDIRICVSAPVGTVTVDL